MPKNSKPSLNYQDAGVDIDAGNRLVELIKPLTMASRKPWADGTLGGFSGVVDLKPAGFQDPLLLLAGDGVGTKLKLAIDYHHHHHIGYDLVAMCVNDLIVQGGKPLAFLDYYACGKLEVHTAATIIGSIAQACVLADCTLIGGETAEMPGMYQAGDYDLAGFALGAVEREHILTPDMANEGDILIGLPSSGAHANGYSLIRKILRHCGQDPLQAPPFTVDYDADDDETPRLIDWLMAPTRIYVKTIMSLLDQHRDKVTGLCHITGGGFYENLPRIFNSSLCAKLNQEAFPRHPLFQWLQQAGNIRDYEMFRSFNCGIGMMIIIKAQGEHEVMEHLQRLGEKPVIIGQLHGKDKRDNSVIIH